MLRRRARPPPPNPFADLMDVENPSIDVEPAVMDSGVFEPEMFEEDAANAALDEIEGDDVAGSVCHLCAVLDDPYNSNNAETARRILEYERCNHGRISDNTLFSQISQCFNEEVVSPAEKLADASPNVQIEVPHRWSRLGVKRHFTVCKQMTRRKLSRLVEQGERLLELVYKGCRVRNPLTGVVKADPISTRAYFQHAQVYSSILIKAKPILEPAMDSTSVILGKRTSATNNINTKSSIWKTMA